MARKTPARVCRGGLTALRRRSGNPELGRLAGSEASRYGAILPIAPIKTSGKGARTTGAPPGPERLRSIQVYLSSPTESERHRSRRAAEDRKSSEVVIERRRRRPA